MKRFSPILRQQPGSPYWFKRRNTGYGWSPSNRQGWLVTTGCIVALLCNAITLISTGSRPSALRILAFILITLFIIGFLTIIAKETGEPL